MHICDVLVEIHKSLTVCGVSIAVRVGNGHDEPVKVGGEGGVGGVFYELIDEVEDGRRSDPLAGVYSAFDEHRVSIAATAA